MPTKIQPMLATAADEAFDDPEWLFEIKFDGYRAIAFLDNGTARLVSRNQNDLTAQYTELRDLAKAVRAKTAILDGEIVALDESGRPSFSLMQQRTGFRGVKRTKQSEEAPILYYAFDLLYADGVDLRRTPLEERKAKLREIVKDETGPLRISDHFVKDGTTLMAAARAQGLEGIVAKRRASFYEERRSRDWLKIKLRHELDCVVGGYTEPEGSRAYFGSVVLGLYDEQGRLHHVGQAGSGFDQRTLAAVWQQLSKRKTAKNPFFGKVEALRPTYWVKPELVATIEFSEWTHATAEGDPKLRAPVFLGLRDDKDPRECRLEDARAEAPEER
jgi:bifunctional non-homologous end joining protein LigD